MGPSPSQASRARQERNQVPETLYGRATGTSELAGQAILTLTTGDTLSLKNVVNTALTFTPNAGGPNDNVAASIVLQQVG